MQNSFATIDHETYHKVKIEKTQVGNIRYYKKNMMTDQTDERSKVRIFFFGETCTYDVYSEVFLETTS